MIRITIFTPTYNRKHLLPNLFESLKKQTCKDFVWLVVDDGSTDGTQELFNEWKSQDVGFKIEYVKKPNGGKHTVIEKANEICTTDYIVCVDSDDYLTESATEQMYNEIKVIDKMEDVCGVVTRKAKPNGEPFGEKWVPNEMNLYFYELSTIYGYFSETCLLFKTNMASKYYFPKFENERFVTESVYYNQFLFKYKMYASNNLYYLAEYMPDGYTAQGLDLFFKNPEGYLYALKQNAFYDIRYKIHGIRSRIGEVASFFAWKRLLKLEEKYPNDNMLPLFYRITGSMLSFMPKKYYRNKKLDFDKRNKKQKGE